MLLAEEVSRIGLFGLEVHMVCKRDIEAHPRNLRGLLRNPLQGD